MIALLIWLVVIGLIVWGVRSYMPPQTEPIRTIIIVALAIVAVLLVLQAFGVADLGMPRLRS